MKCAELNEDVEVVGEYRFEELSDSAKDKVREKYHHWTHDDQWWDSVVDDFTTVAEIFGFSTSRDETYFSGFGCQGDGASFTARYRSPLGSVHEALTKGGYSDEELLRLADEIDLFMAPLRLMRFRAYWDARIYTFSRYSHSGTMQIEEVTRHNDDPYVEISNDELNTAEEVILSVAKSLADWLYNNIEEENDYLYSDEGLANTFQDQKFDESGTML